MPTKQQIRKYVHNLKSCTRIEVYHDNPETGDSHFLWLHFISRKGKFVGLKASLILPSSLDDFQGFVKDNVKTASGLDYACLNDDAARLVRRDHVKGYPRGGVIVRHGKKWTWVK